MKILDLDGTAYERGQQQASALREGFDGLLRSILQSPEWQEHGPPAMPKFLLWGALGAAGRTLTRPSVRRLLPNQADRIRGLAAGLSVSESFAWGVQFLEIVFCQAGSSLAPPPPVGCTVVLAPPSATRSGHTLTGRNYDFPYLLQDHQVIRRERPSEPDRLATTTITQVVLGGAHQGINEAGVTLSGNNARLWRGPHLRMRGVPLSLLLQEVLETCRTAEEARRRVVAFDVGRSNAGFVAIADPSGDACVVELTAQGTRVRHPDEAGVLAQANDFVLMEEANVPEGTRWTVKGMENVEYLIGSRARREAAAAQMTADAGDVTVESIQAVLRDHAGADGGGHGTVCCHGTSGGTLSSMVVDTGSLEMWVAEGAPCEAEYEAVPFRAASPGGNVLP
ncbi:MAG: linear amide C-N hydrolase [Proteobacteria bacterium]|nr:linear amide C-N hydrolase [Pseudomonadota bacterium]